MIVQLYTTTTTESVPRWSFIPINY